MSFNSTTISTALRLEYAQFTTGLGVAGARVKAFAGDVADGSTKAQKAFSDVAGASDKHLKTVGTVGLVAGGAIVAGFGLAAAAALNFDKQMSEVGAVAGATGAELGQLRDAAIKAGAATVFSASQAAQAEAELAKAGVQTSDILAGGLTGALNLASAGSLDLSTAAELAANAMTTFKLNGSAVPHIADVLAASANKSAANVEDMGLALKQGGLVAAQYGISLDETVGTLAMFAQAGLKGSDAGTSFKTMLMRLVPQSAEAKSMMAALGLSFFDANGKFVGLSTVAEQLKTKLGGLSDEQRSTALNTIFGADAIRGATILMQGGSAAVQQWTNDVNQSGYAAELAAKKNDNLAGDLEQLRGSIETTLIQGGSMATTVLRDLAQGATDVVNGLGAMPSVLQLTVIGLTGIVGIGASAIGIYGTLAPKIGDVKKALSEMGPAAQAVGRNLGTMAAAAGVGMIALAQLAQMFDAAGEGARKAKEFIDSVQPQDTSIKAMADSVDQLRVKYDELEKRHKAQKDGVLDMGSAFLDVVVPIHNVEGSLVDTKGALDATGKALDEAEKNADNFASVSRSVASALGITVDQAEKLIAASKVDWNLPLDQATAKVVDYYNALNAGTPASQAMAGAVAGLGDATKTAEDKLKDLTDAVKTFIDTELGSEAAGDALERKLNDLRDAAKDGKLAFQGNSDAALDFRQNMRDLVGDAGDMITQWARLGSQGDDLKTKVYLLSQSLIQQAVDMGVPRAAAEEYFNKLNEIPPDVWTGIHADTSQAQPPVDFFIGRLDRTNQGAHANITADTTDATNEIDALKSHFYQWSFNVPVTLKFRDPFTSANGNIFEAYAVGGIRSIESYANGGESHDAQIAMGGPTRIWNEPETQGEAYIPFATSKRPRSMRILSQVANRFGVGLSDGSGGTATLVREGDTTFNIDARSTGMSPSELMTVALFRKGGRRR